nr:MAG TPA: hypothetical protein [Caudoviricetes sp.]
MCTVFREVIVSQFQYIFFVFRKAIHDTIYSFL